MLMKPKYEIVNIGVGYVVRLRRNKKTISYHNDQSEAQDAAQRYVMEDHEDRMMRDYD